MIGEDVCTTRFVGTVDVDIVAETVEVTITIDGNVEKWIVVDLVVNNEAVVFIIVVVIVEDAASVDVVAIKNRCDSK